MQVRHALTSVARISDLADGNFEVRALPRRQWADADYVAATVTGRPSSLYRFELTDGRLADAMQGTVAIGALGTRAATLEATGDWRAVGEDGLMHALTGAGLFGRATSIAPSLPPLMTLRYEGHVTRGGNKVTMGDFLPSLPRAACAAPIVLLIGTSMSAGKTTTGRIIIHELKAAGLRVAAAKLTGAGRYRDILSFHDAGADAIVDFVDAGLPSTVVAAPRFEQAMTYMLAKIAASAPDVVVAEAGASPLEPYNGDTAVGALAGHIRCTILCASDPYAVLGVREAFAVTPDLVTGPAANTRAGIELVAKLTGIEALNTMEPASLPRLRELLATRLGGVLGPDRR
jgi:hypothetical protein